MKRTLKREFKVLEIVKGEAIGIGEGLGGNQLRATCPAARRWGATLKLGSGQQVALGALAAGAKQDRFGEC